MYILVKKSQTIKSINNTDVLIALDGKKTNVKDIIEQLSQIINTPFDTKKTKLLSKPTLDVFIKGQVIGYVSIESGRMIFSTYSKFVEIKERHITSLAYERAVSRKKHPAKAIRRKSKNCLSWGPRQKPGCIRIF